MPVPIPIFGLETFFRNPKHGKIMFILDPALARGNWCLIYDGVKFCK